MKIQREGFDQMKKKWWHGKVAYQIYPKSFMDSNGDGIGDLKGIISKLDYLKNLGVDIIWLSPVYQSPFIDQGYDISDYYKIAEVFGTMDDFDDLLSEIKKRDMYLIMDLVINHCSDQHEWFQKALKDPKGEYGKYFYFKEGKNGNPPNNYRSYFGQSAWDRVPGYDNLFYLHLFAKQQPDLNWNNQVVKQKLYDMVNWWLEKGVAGFRIDAIINIQKDLEFESFPPDGTDGLVDIHYMIDKVDGVGQMLEELKQHTFQKHDAFTVAEVFHMKKDELREFIGDQGHFSTMFDFSGEVLFAGKHGWYDMPNVSMAQWRDAIFASQKELDDIGFYANIIENHDEPRGASRYLSAYAQNENGVKMLGTVYMFLRGIPFIYQGQEIGMRNGTRKSIDEFDDVNTKGEYEIALKAGISVQEAITVCNKRSRDNARTPMQWSKKENAGFTEGIPWISVNKDYSEINVEEQIARSNSVLHYYQMMIELRKSEEYREVFTYGELVPVATKKNGIFAYLRQNEQKCILVAGNFGTEVESISIVEGCGAIEKQLLKNADYIWYNRNEVSLKPQEAVVLELKNNSFPI